jgi:hypothetical protein
VTTRGASAEFPIETRPGCRHLTRENWRAFPHTLATCGRRYLVGRAPAVSVAPQFLPYGIHRLAASQQEGQYYPCSLPLSTDGSYPSRWAFT